MTPCTLIYPYFRNPDMLRLQVESWRELGDLPISIIVVDDHSPEPALPILKGVPNVSLYRFTTPGLWTMHEARNLGAMKGLKGDEWLFMSDMDILAPKDMLVKLLDKKLDPKRHYTFERGFAPDMTRRKYHCNTFLVRRHIYMAINGYDVDFCGLYGGGYGGDGEFLRQMESRAPRQHLMDILLVGHERDVVPDANTVDWDRDLWKKKYRAVFDAKRKTKDMRSINPVRRAWERLL